MEAAKKWRLTDILESFSIEEFDEYTREDVKASRAFTYNNNSQIVQTDNSSVMKRVIFDETVEKYNNSDSASEEDSPTKHKRRCSLDEEPEFLDHLNYCQSCDKGECCARSEIHCNKSQNPNNIGNRNMTTQEDNTLQSIKDGKVFKIGRLSLEYVDDVDQDIENHEEEDEYDNRVKYNEGEYEEVEECGVEYCEGEYDEEQFDKEEFDRENYDEYEVEEYDGDEFYDGDEWLVDGDEEYVEDIDASPPPPPVRSSSLLEPLDVILEILGEEEEEENKEKLEMAANKKNITRSNISTSIIPPGDNHLENKDKHIDWDFNSNSHSTIEETQFHEANVRRKDNRFEFTENEPRCISSRGFADISRNENLNNSFDKHNVSRSLSSEYPAKCTEKEKLNSLTNEIEEYLRETTLLLESSNNLTVHTQKSNKPLHRETDSNGNIDFMNNTKSDKELSSHSSMKYFSHEHDSLDGNIDIIGHYGVTERANIIRKSETQFEKEKRLGHYKELKLAVMKHGIERQKSDLLDKSNAFDNNHQFSKNEYENGVHKHNGYSPDSFNEIETGMKNKTQGFDYQSQNKNNFYKQHTEEDEITNKSWLRSFEILESTMYADSVRRLSFSESDDQTEENNNIENNEIVEPPINFETTDYVHQNKSITDTHNENEVSNVTLNNFNNTINTKHKNTKRRPLSLEEDFNVPSTFSCLDNLEELCKRLSIEKEKLSEEDVAQKRSSLTSPDLCGNYSNGELPYDMSGQAFDMVPGFVPGNNQTEMPYSSYLGRVIGIHNMVNGKGTVSRNTNITNKYDMITGNTSPPHLPSPDDVDFTEYDSNMSNTALTKESNFSENCSSDTEAEENDSLQALTFRIDEIFSEIEEDVAQLNSSSSDLQYSENEESEEQSQQQLDTILGDLDQMYEQFLEKQKSDETDELETLIARVRLHKDAMQDKTVSSENENKKADRVSLLEVASIASRLSIDISEFDAIQDIIKVSSELKNLCAYHVNGPCWGTSSSPTNPPPRPPQRSSSLRRTSSLRKAPPETPASTAGTTPTLDMSENKSRTAARFSTLRDFEDLNLDIGSFLATIRRENRRCYEMTLRFLLKVMGTTKNLQSENNEDTSHQINQEENFFGRHTKVNAASLMLMMPEAGVGER